MPDRHKAILKNTMPFTLVIILLKWWTLRNWNLIFPEEEEGWSFGQTEGDLVLKQFYNLSDLFAGESGAIKNDGRAYLNQDCLVRCITLAFYLNVRSVPVPPKIELEGGHWISSQYTSLNNFVSEFHENLDFLIDLLKMGGWVWIVKARAQFWP